MELLILLRVLKINPYKTSYFGTDFGPNFQFTGGELATFPSHPNEEVGTVKIQIIDTIRLTILGHALLNHVHWLALCIYMLVRYVNKTFYTHN